IVSAGDLAPEGLVAVELGGKSYLAYANEGSNTTTLYSISISAVPEPTSAAMLGLGMLALSALRRRQK
ncbi:PEP-CTERM sorting domain-containing protein, partial [Methylophilus sp.]|uniref:PEP-CTERM sorting domain-containing protein n=1 Tax=Methylophilus sp. TaxID=29541 RepID=UPI0040381277